MVCVLLVVYITWRMRYQSTNTGLHGLQRILCVQDLNRFEMEQISSTSFALESSSISRKTEKTTKILRKDEMKWMERMFEWMDGFEQSIVLTEQKISMAEKRSEPMNNVHKIKLRKLQQFILYIYIRKICIYTHIFSKFICQTTNGYFSSLVSKWPRCPLSTKIVNRNINIVEPNFE